MSGSPAGDGEIPSPAPGAADSLVKRSPTWLSVTVFGIGLVLTATLTWTSVSIHQHNEERLLNLDLRQAAAVVSTAIPTIQIPLTSAAELAAATGGNPAQFRALMDSYLGGGQFVSASLWRVGGATPELVTAVGAPSELTSLPARASAFLTRARSSPSLSVTSLLDQRQPRIGYASTAPSASVPWVVYGERAVPPNRKLKVTRNSAFSPLNYAIYLGRSTSPRNLLGESEGIQHIQQPRATVAVPFGTSAITLVATPHEELGGSLLARLPLIVAVGGTILAFLAAFMTEYLVRRRRYAEWLAWENRRMYSEQRSIAEVLQHALLPEALPPVAGIETATRYVAGRTGTDVGGDWYDVIPVDDARFLFVLGDVSGRGVEAATIMARLHFAIRAYAAQGDEPTEILGKLGGLLSLEEDRSFVTIVCGLVDVTRHTVTLVNAGHPPVLLLNGTTGEFIGTSVHPPIGVEDATSYDATTFSVPPRATILAFTDGLVERRGETIDVGMGRLLARAIEEPLALDDLLTKLLAGSTQAENSDDTAILGVRWKS
jgi:hypothetical protein